LILSTALAREHAPPELAVELLDHGPLRLRELERAEHAGGGDDRAEGPGAEERAPAHQKFV
jgi:hypothetical protein